MLECQPCATLTGRVQYGYRNQCSALLQPPSLANVRMSSFFLTANLPSTRSWVGGTGMAEEASHETNLDDSGARGGDSTR